MRYPREHKAEIHEKIVKDASHRLRAEGMSGAAVAAVMRDTGLTHGGFYRHFRNKDDLLMESLSEAFQDIANKLARAARRARPEAAWKAIVKTYLSLEYCDHAERGCPVTALAPELARADSRLKSQILSGLVGYMEQMVPFMPGRRKADRECAFFSIFATMVGAVEIARMLPEPAMREKVLASTRNFLLHSF